MPAIRPITLLPIAEKVASIVLSLAFLVIRGSRAVLEIPKMVYTITDIKIYVAYAYIILWLSVAPIGTCISNTIPTNIRGAEAISQGLALPHLVSVLSTRAPIQRSLTPSNTRQTTNMVPIAAALISAVSV